MASHNIKGSLGEQIGVAFLRQAGFFILACNWRFGHWEVDIIAQKQEVLHVVEVKTRHNRSFGYPEESVSRRKLENLRRCAEEYMIQFPQWTRVQFDVLAITRLRGMPDEFFFIEDVY